MKIFSTFSHHVDEGLVEIPPRPRTERRLSDRQKIILICVASAAIPWFLMGVPNFVDFLKGNEVFPITAFDWWWMWRIK